MPNGIPIASDLNILQGFEEEFIVNNIPRDQRMAKKWGVSIKQVYELWNKDRFCNFYEYGVSQRSGWLTEEGEQRLKELRTKERTKGV